MMCYAMWATLVFFLLLLGNNFDKSILLYPCFLEGSFCSESLITFQESRSRSTEACCTDPHLKTCLNIEINPELVEKNDDLNILGIELSHSNTVPPYGHNYKSTGGDEAVISYNPRTKNIFGNFKTQDGKSYSIEKCQNSHVLKEYDVSSFKPDRAITIDKPSLNHIHAKSDDNTTVVTYTVMFYYTKDFAAVTADIPGFIDQLIAETNQGYINSNIPLRIATFCIEQATVNDVADSGELLTAFANMKGSSFALRNTADAAALLCHKFSSCGIAYLGTFSSGWTVSVTQKSCALGYYSFGHEIGHNYGAHHNPEVSSNTQFPFGHGHLIAQGTASTGRRSILAYNAKNHGLRVNYYSNPHVILPETGTPTGVAGVSNNAAVFIQIRHTFASLGDESAVCNDGSSPTTSTSPSPPPSTVSCGNCVFSFMYCGRIYDRYGMIQTLLIIGALVCLC